MTTLSYLPPPTLKQPEDAGLYLSETLPDYLALASLLLKEGVGQQLVQGLLQDVSEVCDALGQYLSQGVVPELEDLRGESMKTVTDAALEFAELLDGGETAHEFVLARLLKMQGDAAALSGC